MAAITLYDLLGVADAPVPRDAAADLWPSHLVQGSTGLRDQPDPAETRAIVEFLNAALAFRNVRPGADPDRVGLTAEVLVGLAPSPLPLVLAAMPDVEFHLLPTSSEPARVTVTSGDLGTELLVEALPVEIKLPIGLLAPLEPPGPRRRPPPTPRSTASSRATTTRCASSSIAASPRRSSCTSRSG
jgi:hypothetical protein